MRDILDLITEKKLTINDLNQQIYTEALQRSGGKVSAAARMLGITRPQLVYRAKATALGQ